MGERIRGRKGQEALARRRRMHPRCAECAAMGIDRASDEIDHTVPLALGGEDVDDNTQGLCYVHHAIKTALEDASRGGAANHPEWLKPSRAHLMIVSGPPCAGKTTLVEQEAGPRDMVIDLDALATAARPSWGRRWDADLLNRCIRARNGMLGSLSRLPPAARAWFIISAPTMAELKWWTDALKPDSVRRLDPGEAVCVERAMRRENAGLAVDTVRAWYARSREPWRLPKAAKRRQAFGTDGYPIEEDGE